MKFLLNQSVCEIRAKSISDDWYTKSETMSVLNYLSIVFDKAADKYEQDGEKILAHICRQDATHIYNKLYDAGYYKD